jgi:hypothetical protein
VLRILNIVEVKNTIILFLQFSIYFYIFCVPFFSVFVQYLKIFEPVC